MRSAWWAGVLVLCATGCGAKSGLLVPDASLDAAPDATVDAAVVPVTETVCIEVVDPTRPVTASLTLPVSLRAVDLMLVIDATASMEDEINNVRQRLVGTVIPAIRDQIEDVQLGVAFVGEFPVDPHGPPDIAPYELRAPIGTAPLQLEGALQALPQWGNFDHPEAQVEGLFQVATGEGLLPFVQPALGCVAGGFGGACFRPEAFSVVALITDAPMHNGPPGVDPEDRYTFSPTPHTYAETIRQLRERSVVVLGLGARDRDGPSPMAHLRALARDTGAVDANGAPLVFNIGSTGTQTGEGLVEAITRLAAELPLDVTATVADVPGDAVDARTLVREIRPQSASPASGVGSRTAEGFVDVIPGTEVTFELVLDPEALTALQPGARVDARVVFLSGRSVLAERDVVIVGPGSSEGCP